jgi:hypothetical protein
MRSQIYNSHSTIFFIWIFWLTVKMKEINLWKQAIQNYIENKVYSTLKYLNISIMVEFLDTTRYFLCFQEKNHKVLIPVNNWKLLFLNKGCFSHVFHKSVFFVPPVLIKFGTRYRILMREIIIFTKDLILSQNMIQFWYITIIHILLKILRAKPNTC